MFFGWFSLLFPKKQGKDDQGVARLAILFHAMPSITGSDRGVFSKMSTV